MPCTLAAGRPTLRGGAAAAGAGAGPWHVAGMTAEGLHGNQVNEIYEKALTYTFHP